MWLTSEVHKFVFYQFQSSSSSFYLASLLESSLHTVHSLSEVSCGGAGPLILPENISVKAAALRSISLVYLFPLDPTLLHFQLPTTSYPDRRCYLGSPSTMEKPDHRSVRSRSASVSSQGELEQWCEQNGGFSDILDPEDGHAALFASLGIPTRKELEVQWHAQMFGTTASQQASANTSSSQSARETRLNPVTTSETFVELPSNKRRKHAPQISANNRTPTGLTADRNQTQTEKACNRCRVCLIWKKFLSSAWSVWL